MQREGNTMNRSSIVLILLASVLGLLCAESAAQSQQDSQTNAQSMLELRPIYPPDLLNPPRIDRFEPKPNSGRIVDNLGVRTLEIGFNEPVRVPPQSVQVWGVTGGDLSFKEFAYDPDEQLLTIELEYTVLADILTVVVDYSIRSLDNVPLDGELGSPSLVVVPSGNGIPGGRAVARFEILQGDANRDGVVDIADANLISISLGLSAGDPGFNPLADLNSDGVVNALDLVIWSDGQGLTLPTVGEFPPVITGITPDPESFIDQDLSEITIRYSSELDLSRIEPRDLFVSLPNLETIAANSVSLSADGLGLVFGFEPALLLCDQYTLNISPSIVDLTGALAVLPNQQPVISGLRPPPSVVIDPHDSRTDQFSITLTGVASGASYLEVTGPGGNSTRPVIDGTFQIQALLAPNSVNNLFLTAVNSCGIRSAPAVTQVTMDAESPSVFIDFPVDGARIQSDTTDVAGRISDRLSGTEGFTVTVNGQQADVNIGIGTNGTFFLPNVPLNPDVPTDIVVEAHDSLQNNRVISITVERTQIPDSTPRMEIIGGNAQTGIVHSPLQSPIAIQMFRADGSPFAGKVVTFQVSRSDGRLGDSIAHVVNSGSRMYQVTTNSQGIAEAFWALGSDAGMGNNRVSVTSRDIAGTVLFCASSTPASPNRILIGGMNNQRAETGSPLSEPLRVWVTDGCNGIANIDVTFSVTENNGVFSNGAPIITGTTDATGHLDMPFELGLVGGVNVIEANFDGNPRLPATFTFTGIERNLDTPTSLVGTVLDNASRPLGNARMELRIGGPIVAETFTDSQGRFEFTDVPSGAAHLVADGSTADTLAGEPIQPNSFPFVGYDFTMVPNAENRLPQSVLLPQYNPANRFLYDGTQDVILTIEGIEGLKFTVAAGTTVRLVDGTVIDGVNGNSVDLTLDQVHFDDIPMPLPDAASYPLAWTLQPKAATFDPPIEVELPNMIGLPAGAIGYILQWDGELDTFVITASGQVSEDGSIIKSDPGAGIAVAGWGGACPPYGPSGDSGNPGDNPSCPSNPSNNDFLNTVNTRIAEKINQIEQQRAIIPDLRQSIYRALSEDTGEFFGPPGTPGFSETALLLEIAAYQLTFCAPSGGITCFSAAAAAISAGAIAANSFSATLSAILEHDIQVSLLQAYIIDLQGLLAQREIACATLQVESFITDFWDDANQSYEQYVQPLLNEMLATTERLIENTNLYLDQASSILDYLNGQPLGPGGDNLEDMLDNLEVLSQSIIIDIEYTMDVAQDWDSEFAKLNLLGSSGSISLIADGANFENFTVSIGAQFSEVSEGGAFVVSGIPTTEGMPLRPLLTGTLLGEPIYGQAPLIEILDGQETGVGIFELSRIPFPVLSSLDTQSDTSILAPGQTTEVNTFGIMSNGSKVPLQTFADGTVYNSSNPAVVSVDSAGLATAISPGTAFISVLNLGVSAVERIDVTEMIVSTTVIGVVLMPDGSPAVGSTVSTTFGGKAMTDADGSFTIHLDQAPPNTSLSVFATFVEMGQSFAGGSDPTHIVSSGLTDAGVITINPIGNGSLFPSEKYFAGDRPEFVSLGDLDGDGDLDMALSNGDSNDVSVLLNNSDGTFAPQARYAAGDTPGGVSLGDVDGDGNLDMVVANFVSDDVSVLLNNSDGTFAPQTRFASGNGSFDVSLGDLDGDGDLDMAVAVATSDDVNVLLNNGNGTFKFLASYEAGNSPRGVALGDLDGDGHLDIAVANWFSGDTSVLLNNGNGTFAPQIRYAAGNGLESVSLGDLDGDGDLDIALNGSVLLNNGNGNFGPPALFPGADNRTGVSLGDLDGDGDLDMTFTNFGAAGILDYVSVLLNNGGGMFAVQDNYTTGDDPSSVSLGDLDGDGDLDMAVANRGTDDTSVLLNNGDGTFVSQNLYDAGDNSQSVALGDLDDDGDLDMAVANWRSDDVSVLFNNGNGTYAPQIPYSAGNGSFDVSLGDLDGDGDLDMAVANLLSDDTSVLLNNSDGTFAPQIRFAAGDSPEAVSLGDLDGDGLLDIAVANSRSDDISVLLNTGDGTFSAQTRYGAGDFPQSVSLGDLDGDGDLDMAVVNLFAGVSVLLNDGDGTFAYQTLYAAGDRPEAVSLGDLDGDGHLDIAVANSSSDDTSVLLNNGNGTFAPQIRYAAGNGPESVSLGDLDGDGDLDIASANYYSKDMSVLLNIGDGTFATETRFSLGNGPVSISLGDLDGDGDLDVASTNLGLTASDFLGNDISVLLNRSILPPGGAPILAGGNGPSNSTAPAYPRRPAKPDPRESAPKLSPTSPVRLVNGIDSPKRMVRLRSARPLTPAEASALLDEHSKNPLINPLGQRLENRTVADGLMRAYLIEPDGTEILLPTLGGDDSVGHALNPRGDVVGLSTLPDGRVEGFVWYYDAGPIEPMGTLGGPGSAATHWHAPGVVLGDADDRDLLARAVLWLPGHGLLDLNSLIEPGSGLILTRSRATLPGGSVLVEALTDEGRSVFVHLELELYESPRADLNFDGIVDLSDLSLLLGMIEGGDMAGDLNADGRLDLFDVALLTTSMGQTAEPIQGSDME